MEWEVAIKICLIDQVEEAMTNLNQPQKLINNGGKPQFHRPAPIYTTSIEMELHISPTMSCRKELQANGYASSRSASKADE